MKLLIPLSENGYLPDMYGKYAPRGACIGGNPVVSFPFTIEDAPSGVKSYALVMIDYDSTPVCGFPWIHWIMCDLPGDARGLPENASALCAYGIVQGRNSSASRFVGERDPRVFCRYSGPMPPDKDHEYTVTLYALDTPSLGLKEGFFLSDLLHAIKGHILSSDTVGVMSRR